MLQELPPKLVQGFEGQRKEGLDGIIKAAKWDTNVFLLSRDDRLLLVEKIFDDLGLVEVSPP